MKVLNYILGLTGVYTSLWMNEMKYVWMNEKNSVFAKEGSLVEVPYVEPSFWEVLMSSPWFQGLMAYEEMIWTICMMMHGTLIAWLSWSDLASPLTFLIQIWQVHLLDFPYIMLLRKSYSYSCMSLVCAFIYPYLVQVCNNPYNSSFFSAGTG